MEAAKHHRINQLVVSRLVCKLRKKPSLFSDMLLKHEEKQQVRDQVKEHVTMKIEQDYFVDSAKDVKIQLKHEKQLDV